MSPPYVWKSIRDTRDTASWRVVIEFLGLDITALKALFLLVAQGEAGRAEANRILHTLLEKSNAFRGNSRECSRLVNEARLQIDRPPFASCNGFEFSRITTVRDNIYRAQAPPPRPSSLMIVANGHLHLGRMVVDLVVAKLGRLVLEAWLG